MISKVIVTSGKLLRISYKRFGSSCSYSSLLLTAENILVLAHLPLTDSNYELIEFRPVNGNEKRIGRKTFIKLNARLSFIDSNTLA